MVKEYTTPSYGAMPLGECDGAAELVSPDLNNLTPKVIQICPMMVDETTGSIIYTLWSNGAVWAYWVQDKEWKESAISKISYEGLTKCDS